MNNTFGKLSIRNLKIARTILKDENVGSYRNNRDTQMIDQAIKIIDQVIKFNKPKRKK